MELAIQEVYKQLLNSKVPKELLSEQNLYETEISLIQALGENFSVSSGLGHLWLTGSYIRLSCKHEVLNRGHQEH